MKKAAKTGKKKEQLEREAGEEAGRQVRHETLEACRALGITPKSVLLNLKRLSRFKGAKPFCFQGDIFMSDPLDYPEVQLGATKELALILDMHPSEKLDGNLAVALTFALESDQTDKEPGLETE